MGEHMSSEEEIGCKALIGRHWRTIQGSLFPEWEREMDEKFIEEEKRRRKAGKEAVRVSRGTGRCL